LEVVKIFWKRKIMRKRNGERVGEIEQFILFLKFYKFFQNSKQVRRSKCQKPRTRKQLLYKCSQLPPYPPQVAVGGWQKAWCIC
jgi:hypothetical protein